MAIATMTAATMTAATSARSAGTAADCAAVPGTDRCRRAGCAGQTGALCPHHTRFVARMAVGELCREACWGSLFCAVFRDANAVCGRTAEDDEWEAVDGRAVTTIVGVVNGGGCGVDGSPDPAAPRSCTAAHPCATPHVAATDNCFSHYDVDFNFHLSPRDLSVLSPENLWGGGSDGGADLEVEWEWMFAFPTVRAQPRPALAPVIAGLGVPWPGDAVAAQGALITDCGHTGSSGFSRTELHPPAALAWIHADRPDRHTLWIRASTRSTYPQGARAGFPAALDAIVPLPGGPGAARLVGVGAPAYDYLWERPDIQVDASCRLLVSSAPYACVLPAIAIAATGDRLGSPFARACREEPGAHLTGGAAWSRAQLDALAAGTRADPWFAIQVEPAGPHAVRVRVRALGDAAGAPTLIGLHVPLTTCAPGPGCADPP